MTNRTTRVWLASAVALAMLLAHSIPPAGAATSSCEVDNVERIVAVGDVHGAYDRLVGILRAADIINARAHWSAGKTHLVQLGDAGGLEMRPDLDPRDVDSREDDGIHDRDDEWLATVALLAPRFVALARVVVERVVAEPAGSRWSRASA